MGESEDEMNRYFTERSEEMPSHKKLSLANIYRPTTPLQMWAYRKAFSYHLK